MNLKSQRTEKDINQASKIAIEGLKPELLWEKFFNISRIPRESQKETKIQDYLQVQRISLGRRTL